MILIDDISCSTDVLILIIAGCPALFLVFGCVVMLFHPLPAMNTINWGSIAELVIIPSIICVILFVISTLTRKLVAKRSRLFRCKCLSLIGYGGIALCGILPRISYYFIVGKEDSIFGYIAFISYATSILIYFVILLPNAKNLKVNYDLDGTKLWFWKHVVIHSIVLIVQARIAIALFESKRDREAIILCQMLYSIICGPSIFDFCQVLRGGGVKLRHNNNKRINGDDEEQDLVTEYVEMGIPKKTTASEPENKFELECKNCRKNNQNQGLVAGNEKNVKATEIPELNFKVECKICMLEYSETRIPRILRECGHTICEECANEMLKKNNQRHLCCPFCQEITLVKGPANLLAKNYVALEFLEQIKQKNCKLA